MVKKRRIDAKGDKNLKNVLFPVIPLPSVQLCLANSVPISCIRDREIDKLFRVKSLECPDDLNQLETNLEILGTDKLDEDALCRETQQNKDLDQLKAELALIKSLYSYIERGIWNKQRILSVYELGYGNVYKDMSGLESLYRHCTTLSPFASLIRSLLTCMSEQETETQDQVSKDASAQESLKRKFEECSGLQVCFDRLPLSSLKISDFYDSRLYQDIEPKDENTTNEDNSEEEMFQNLVQGKLCNGQEAKKPHELAISLILSNKYDCISPRLLTRVLGDYRIINAISKH
ncbi:hypothetical protein BEWA_002830 [Theileria equi strain WA]|uniref:Uncharacterized protein n=1 Tax=Theileria equi strain WA TaxID=1537102 RepID=L0B0W2_THEEQ|nr:hypothetical protein BEWA_002830 [Theileria equi strain WA]AFZ80876.1 hypothetical protein BEWA_002830 [Theileria equi strain WA]|eukprot:XP_004830542.1 hypothetical protein BEWA_002830 [Theileria equi strain WA]